MNHETNAALQALIQQVSALTDKVDAQDKKFDDVFKVNDRLLGKIKSTGDTPKTDWDQVQKSVEKFLGRDKDEALEKFCREGEAVQILRSEALDAAKYGAAKQLAAEQGVALEIVDDRDGAGEEQRRNDFYREIDTSAIDALEDNSQKIRYVRQDVAYGGAGWVQNSIAAERDGFKLRTFKDASDLPEHMQTKLDLMARAAQADEQPAE